MRSRPAYRCGPQDKARVTDSRSGDPARDPIIVVETGGGIVIHEVAYVRACAGDEQPVEPLSKSWHVGTELRELLCGCTGCACARSMGRTVPEDVKVLVVV